MTITFAAYTDTSPNALTARLHRAPRARLRDSDGTAIQLHRAHAVAMQGSRSPIHASMRFTRTPQVRLSDRTGDLLLLHRAPQLNLSGAAPIPTITVFSLAAPAHRIRMAISRHHALQFHHQPRVLLAAGVRFALQRRRHVLLRDDGVTSDRTALMFQQPELLSSMVPGLTVQLASGIGLHGQHLHRQMIALLRSGMALDAQVSSLAQILKRIDDSIGLAVLVEHVLGLGLFDQVALASSSAASELRLLALMDALAIGTTAGSLQEATRALAVVLALNDVIATPTLATLTSGWLVHSHMTAAVEAYAAALSAIRMDAVLHNHLLLTAVLRDAVGVADHVSSLAELLATLRSAIGASVNLQLDGQAQTAWVMDLGAKTVWTYDNYPFNSFAKLGDMQLAAGPEGIVELTGSDDNGTPIAWSARTGLTNLGTMLQKRLDALYLGYTSAGQVGISVIATGEDGDKTQYNYVLPTRTANAVVQNRLKLGQGVESVYFAFEFAGTGPFQLADAQLLPLRTTRRN